MRGINKVILVCRVGADPEIRNTNSGSTVANLSVATSEKYKDKASGEMIEKTEWHKVVYFGRLAEVVSEYVGKGDPLYIEGQLQTEKWQDKDGNDRYTTKIKGFILEMLKSNGANAGGQAAPGNAPPAAAVSNVPF